MWNRSIKLPSGKNTVTDEDGYDTEVYTYMEHIPANFTDLTRNDQILASQCGYAASINVEVMACNYAGQNVLIEEQTGDEYEVKRTFQKEKGMSVLLTCERRQNGSICNGRIR